MLSKKEAFHLLDELVTNDYLKKHMIAVSAIMKRLAKKLRTNELKWELVGLLHDIDYQKINNDMSKHGLVSAEMLEGKLSKSSLHAIMAHDPRTGLEPHGILDKALIASDAVSGLIIATALIMPSKKISEIKLRTLKKKFKDSSFARKVQRNRIEACKEIGLALDDFFRLALESLQEVSVELGL